MKLRKKIKRFVVVQFIRTLFWYFNSIPRSLAMFTGGLLGITAWKFTPRDRHRINRHLTLALGDKLNDIERHNIGRNFFINSGKNIADVIRLKKHFHSEILPLIETDGIEHLENAYQRGKGVFGITGHLGNFELSATYIRSLGYEVAVIGRELYDKRLDEILVSNRSAMGLTNFSTTDSPLRIIKWLKRGKAIGVLIDTDSTRVRSDFVPSFGRMANTPIGQSLIALKTGAAMVPMACIRLSNNRYRMIGRPEIRIEQTGNDLEDAIALTSACNQALEKIILEYKDQWIWLHNRWHTKLDQEST